MGIASRLGMGDPAPERPPATGETPELGPDSTPDEVLDAAVEYTFPASDPIAVQDAYTSAARRRQAND